MSKPMWSAGHMAVHRQLNACTMIVVDKYHGITRLTAEGGTHNVPGFFLKYMQYIMMANIIPITDRQQRTIINTIQQVAPVGII